MEDAPLLVGRTFTDVLRSLSITALAKVGSNADTYLDIEVRFGSTPPVDLGEALELPGAAWIAGGDQPWVGQSLETHDGTDAASSGAINHKEQSYVETTLTGPGTLAFWWRVSSESGYDFLSFLSDGLVVESISGEQAWRRLSSFLPAGRHTLRWRYSKDGSVVAGSDRAWLDQVTFTPTNGVSVNDMFGDRTVVQSSTTLLAASDLGATKEVGEPNHAGNPGGASVWWTWTARTTGTASIDTMGSSFDTLLGVYTGTSVDNLTLIAANDDSNGGLTSAATLAVVAGTTYQIAVDGYGAASGNIRLSITPPTPVNDLFAERVTVPGGSAVVSGSNVGATKESGEPNHGGNTGGTSVWWSWTAPASGATSITTVGSSFDALLGVYTGPSVSSLTLVAGNGDRGGDLTSAVTITAIAGTTYQIAVDGDGGASGNIRLSITPPTPANDLFADRITVPGNSTVMTGSNVGATEESGEPNHGGNTGGKSVWWSWTAPTSGIMQLTTDGSSFDTLLAVYTGSSVSSLTLIGGDDDSGQGTASAVRFVTTAGTTYQIAVDGYSRQSGTIRLNLRALAPLRLSSILRRSDGICRIWIESSDSTAIDPIRIRTVDVHATTNIAQPLAGWTRLTNSLKAANGLLWVDDPAASSLSMRFYCVSERP
jgi:hypothetical protein